MRAFHATVTSLALALWGCQAPPQVGTMLLGVAGGQGGSPAGAVQRLSGQAGVDFSQALIGGAQRFGRGGGSHRAPGLSLLAYGDYSANWTNGGKAGLPLNTLGCSATDKATNGAAVRYQGPLRLIVVTREGKLLDLNPDTPAVGGVVTDLTVGAPATFTKTYVSLSVDASMACVISDQGNAYAIDLDAVTAGAHPFKRTATGQGACVGTALYIDPLSVSGRNGKAYCVANNGQAVRMTFTQGANWAGSTWTATALGKVTPITTVIPGLAGTELVKSAPVALDGKLYVGDRRGNMNRFDTATSARTTWAVNPSWPVETPPALDVDDNLNVTDVFVAAGPKLAWINPATNAIRQGQNALVEKGGPSGTITPTTVQNFLDSSEQTFGADWNNKDAFSVYDTAQPQTSLPGAPGPVDINYLSYGSKVTGQSPFVYAWSGTQGTTAARVPEGQDAATARFNSPWGLDWDTDGSVYVANRDASQVIVKPNSTATVGIWTGLPYAIDPSRYYEIAGIQDGNNYNIGNGRWSHTPTRQTRLTQVRDVAIGNLGMYVAVSNGGWLGGKLLFLPKNGVNTAFGQPMQTLELYVLSNNCDPNAVIVDRRTAGRDIVYVASGTQTNAPNARALLKLDSASSADVQVVTNFHMDDPQDVAVDDKGNVFVADPSGTPEVIMWFVGGGGNNRKWGIPTPVANTAYNIVPTGLNYSIWNVTFGANDPQALGGVLYMGSTQWGSVPNAIYRMDDTGTPVLLGGSPQNGGSTGDGGFATAAKFNAPRGLATDGVGNLYIADTGNQRIRKLIIPAFTGPEAKGLMKFNFGSYYKRPVLYARLRMTSRRADSLKPPRVGVASSYLDGTTTTWTADTMVAAQAPDIDLGGGVATPTSPAVDGAGNWNLAVDTQVTYEIPPGAFPAGFQSGAAGDYLCVGLARPDDGVDYYYPTSVGVPAGQKRAFAFHTPRSDSGKTPQLTARIGQTNVTRPILSPPAIYGDGVNRWVYVANGNSLFRYKANPATPSAFSSAVDFTYGRVMRKYSDGAKIYTPDTSFQPNAAPPLVNWSGQVHMLDVRFRQWNNTALYALNAFDGAAGSANMTIGAHQYRDVTDMNDENAGQTPATADDNAGTYIVSDFNLADTYFGLSNGRLYRMGL